MADRDKGASALDQSIASRPRLVAAINKQALLEDLWDRGLPSGFKSGWPSVDKFYTVVPGQLTIVTGWPGSGKSEWVDALAVHLTRQGWRVAFYSPENLPIELHVAKILEKISGQPFGHGPTSRIGRERISEMVQDMDRQFRFLEPMEGAVGVRDVLEATLPWLQSSDAPSGLVIDPWNELEHWRPANLSETEYVSAALSEVRQWARKHNIHVWIIAHPQKIRREDGHLPVPKPDMISGSQHWWNKADCCISVYRKLDDPERQDVEIHVQKVRFKHVGRPGLIDLKYDRITGRYHEPSMIRSYDESRG